MSATNMVGVPTLQGQNLGPQSNGIGFTTGAPPNKPDFATYFGKPLREVKTNPYEGYARENYALPEAYNGPNPFITRILTQLITEDDMWITRIALPFKFTEDSMEFAWNVWIFNNHGMDSVPEEGVSRLLSTQMGERRGHYTRYGLGFILEHGFMKTEKGRLCYEMNLVQIRNAVLETLYYGGIEEYLMCKEYNNKWNARHGRRMEFASIREQMQMEIDNWACIQKGDGSWDLLDSRCKRVLQDAGHQPNMWILPRGMKPYIALDQSKTAYFMTGPEGRQLYNSALNGQNVNAIDTSNNCQIFESKAFQMPEQNEPLDLLWRERSCGEYYLMVNHLAGYPMDKYASNWRDIAIYNEKRDQFNPVTLRTALDNCGRFEPSHPHHLIDDPDDNLFRYMDENKQNYTCIFFGDMHNDNLSDDTKRNIATTILSPIVNPNCCDDFYEVWKDGMLLVRELEDTKMSDLWYLYLTTGGDNAPALKVDSQTNFVPLPPPGAKVNDGTKDIELFVNGLPTFTPSGFASWPGLCALAHLSNKHMGPYHTRALRFTNVIRQLYDRLNQSFYQSVFLDSKHRSGFFVKPDGITTFFENLVSVPRPNLWFNANDQGTQKDKLAINAANLLTLSNVLSFDPKYIMETAPTANDQLVDWFAAQCLGSETDEKFMTITERMRNLLDGSNAWNKINVRDMLVQLVYIFAIMKSTPTDGMKKALKFLGTLFKILDTASIDMESKAKELFTRIACAVSVLKGPLTTAELEDRSEKIVTGTFDKAEMAAAEKITNLGTAISKSAATNTIDIWKPTQLIASKLIAIGLYAKAGAKLLPSGRIAGTVPPIPQNLGLEWPPGLEQGPSLDSKGVRVDLTPDVNQLFAARDGSESHVPFTIGHTTHMNTMEPEISRVGSKRGASEIETYAFGARRRVELIDEDQRTDNDYIYDYAKGNDRNIGRTGMGLYVRFAQPFRTEFNKWIPESNQFHRIIIQAFLGTPITKQALINMIDNHVFFPLGFLLARPHITHMMGTAILTTSGAEVGETRVGHADFQLSDNVVQKMHYGNFTFYAKSVIYAPEKVLIVTDIISKRYLYGDDMLFFENNDQYAAFRRGNNEKRSILSMIIPADAHVGGREYPNPIDLTGNYSEAMANLSDGMGPDLHYASAGYYARYFGFNNQRQELNSNDYFNYFNNQNTIVYQGHQFNWNPGANAHTFVVQNTGHWSYRVYEGVGAVRNGSMKLMREVNYSMYGGGGGAVPKVPLGY